MKNAIIEQVESTDLSVIDYNVTDAAIAELRKKHVAIPVSGNKELAIVQKSITELTGIRTSVEKKRKELKAGALEFGKKVDTEAKRITGLLEEIEQPLVDAKKAYNEEQERIKAEIAAKEKARVDVIMQRIISIQNRVLEVTDKSADEIGATQLQLTDELVMGDGFDYAELAEQARTARKETLAKLSAMKSTRKAWEDEQAAAAIRQKEAEAERIKLEAAQAKLKEEQRAFEEKQAEAARVEQEKAAAARKTQEEAEHAQRLAELERQKAENARLAEIEEKRLSVEREQLELDRQKAAHEEKIAADKARAEREFAQRESVRIDAERVEKMAQESRIAQAAPDLLTALEYFYNISHDLKSSIAKGYIQVAQEQAKTAIAKARGVEND